MATRTISIDLDAYQRLSSARVKASESFSQVIKPATWQEKRKTCQALLSALREMPIASDAVLERLEKAQQNDLPPDNSWA